MPTVYPTSTELLDSTPLPGLFSGLSRATYVRSRTDMQAVCAHHPIVDSCLRAAPKGQLLLQG
jgi:hypothetical protein